MLNMHLATEQKALKITIHMYNYAHFDIEKTRQS